MDADFPGQVGLSCSSGRTRDISPIGRHWRTGCPAISTLPRRPRSRDLDHHQAPQELRWSALTCEVKSSIPTRVRSTQLIFEGSAGEAVSLFPRNLNIAASVSLSGLGFEKTRVRIVADPTKESPIIALEADGKFGALRLELRTNPDTSNTDSSLASLSAIGVSQEYWITTSNRCVTGRPCPKPASGSSRFEGRPHRRSVDCITVIHKGLLHVGSKLD